jgi:hypothetical protein
MDDNPATEPGEEGLPRPVPESGLPGGGSSVTGGKAPPGSAETEDVRENVVGGPADETVGPVEPDDKFGSKRGAAAAMQGSEEKDEDPSQGGSGDLTPST